MYLSFNARAVGLDLSALETIELAAKTGFQGVDLLVRDIMEAGDEPNALRDRMEELNLRGGAWPLPVDWKGTQSRFLEDLRKLPERARVAATLGLQRTGTWVLPSLPPLGPPGDKALDWHVERLGAIAHILADYDIRLGFEVVGVESFRKRLGGEPFLHRLIDLDPLMNRLLNEAGNVGVLVDAFHLFAAGEAVETAFKWGVEKVIWVHLADLPAGAPLNRSFLEDAPRGLPGECGAVDCQKLLKLLAKAGYDGPITIEPMAGCRSINDLQPEAMAQALIGSVKTFWPSA